ncbi:MULTISPECIES: hypothetical protein [unclassified Luteimonas]|uniref:hypothetical protein n=1 Tax=unclassified Luteimonas TaxID=2629088 RepID=UPI0018F0A50E|nr:MULTISPECIES: hypothetical protein [unclassified Luteimonas]MBJ6981571.1 hypothetical protein [Luteimonas sp. MC1572]MBJ7575861.1 hypothetical protein [Luteimonas sp. MC1828]QQO02870.1 hypothetical protein JGR64_12000 [Luteimonas sp. MC1572]
MSDASPAMTESELDDAIAELEDQMADLQLRHKDLFAYANAWAERHDAIMRRAPEELRPDASARLRRIGIRWGLADGARMTTQFPALRRA